MSINFRKLNRQVLPFKPEAKRGINSDEDFKREFSI